MMTKFNRLIRERKAQGMTEYIIIVALIAIGSIFAITLFGNNIRSLFSASTQALTGSTSVDPKFDTRTAETKKGLNEFYKSK